MARTIGLARCPDELLTSVPQALIDEQGEWGRTTVEDHETGLPAAIRDCIFDPFFASKDRDQDAGLGLWVN